MKTFTIEIEDSKYDEFIDFCKLNSIEPETFIVKAFLERYFLLKYGDLNDVVVEKPKKKKQTKKETNEFVKEHPEKHDSEENVREEKKEIKTSEEKPKKRVRIIESH